MSKNPSPPIPGLALVLATAVTAAYLNTFSVPLLFDDIPGIANNPTIRHWGSAWWGPIKTTAAGRPVLNLSLALNFAISGLRVWSYHAVNLGIHLLAALLLFGIVRRTLAGRIEERRAGEIAFFSALLWALHPLQTESVTYIVQRAESLMGLFYLLTLYAFVRFAGVESDGEAAGPPLPRPGGRPVWGMLAVTACLLGMATKEVMVSAPLVVLLYDRTFLAGSFRAAWRRRWRLHAGLISTWAVLPVLVHFAHNRGGTAGFGGEVSWWKYALTQPGAIVRYLRLTFWPHPQVFYYGPEWVKEAGSALPGALLLIVLCTGTLWALFRPEPTARFLGFAGAWFFLILAPSSLVPIYEQTAAEHRMYLALVPVAALGVIGIYRRLGRWSAPACLILGAGLGLATAARNRVYRSAVAIWADTVEHCPDNVNARDNLACELTKIPGGFEEAIAQCEEALRRKPDDAAAYNNMGFAIETGLHRPIEAIARYREAVRLDPSLAAAHYNLAHALNGEGWAREAIPEYEESLRLDPDYSDAHYNLGCALVGEGEAGAAAAEFAAALRLQPEHAGAHNNLGLLLLNQGRTPEAIRHLETALRLEPNDPSVHVNLALALLQTPERAGEAVALLREALRLRPNDERALRLLATIQR